MGSRPTGSSEPAARRVHHADPEGRRSSKAKTEQQDAIDFDDKTGLDRPKQQYDLRRSSTSCADAWTRWRELKNPNDWGVTPETARLLQHWRHHPFSGVRPFFCQVEAVETAIWLTEVAPQRSATASGSSSTSTTANADANPELRASR